MGVLYPLQVMGPRMWRKALDFVRVLMVAQLAGSLAQYRDPISHPARVLTALYTAQANATSATINVACGLRPAKPSYLTFARDYGQQSPNNAKAVVQIEAEDATNVHLRILGQAEDAAQPLLEEYASGNTTDLEDMDRQLAAGEPIPDRLKSVIRPLPGNPGGPPVGALLLFYRRDWWEGLRGKNASAPYTWSDFIKTMTSLQGGDLDGDGDNKGELVLCVDLMPGCKGWAVLAAIFASLLQSKGSGSGLWFNTTDMNSTLGGPAMAGALELYTQLAENNVPFYTPGGTTLSRVPISNTSAIWDELVALRAVNTTTNETICGAVNPLFTAGRCLFTIDWTPAILHMTRKYAEVAGRLGVALLPGSDKVQVESGAGFVQCTATTCPYTFFPGASASAGLTEAVNGSAVNGSAVNGLAVNQAPFVGEVTNVWIESPNTTDAVQAQTHDFMSYTGFYLGLKYGLMFTVVLANSSSDPGNNQQLTPTDTRDTCSPTQRGLSYLLDSTGTATVAAAGTILDLDSNDLRGGVLATIDAVRHPNAAYDILLPYSSQYRTVLDGLASGTLEEEAAVRAANGSGLPAERLQTLATDANEAFLSIREKFPYSNVLRALYVEPFNSAAANASNSRSSNWRLTIVLPTVLSTGVVLLVLLAAVLFMWYLARHRRSSGILAPSAGPATTLVMTDVQNSTLLWETLPSGIMDLSMRVHHNIMRKHIEANHGYEVFTEGDAFAVAFHNPADALSFAMDVQVNLLGADWPPALLAQPDGCEVWAQPTTPSTAPAEGDPASGSSLLSSRVTAGGPCALSQQQQQQARSRSASQEGGQGSLVRAAQTAGREPDKATPRRAGGHRISRLGELRREAAGLMRSVSNDGSSCPTSLSTGAAMEPVAAMAPDAAITSSSLAQAPASAGSGTGGKHATASDSTGGTSGAAKRSAPLPEPAAPPPPMGLNEPQAATSAAATTPRSTACVPPVAAAASAAAAAVSVDERRERADLPLSSDSDSDTESEGSDESSMNNLGASIGPLGLREETTGGKDVVAATAGAVTSTAAAAARTTAAASGGPGSRPRSDAMGDLVGPEFGGPNVEEELHQMDWRRLVTWDTNVAAEPKPFGQPHYRHRKQESRGAEVAAAPVGAEAGPISRALQTVLSTGRRRQPPAPLRTQPSGLPGGFEACSPVSARGNPRISIFRELEPRGSQGTPKSSLLASPTARDSPRASMMNSVVRAAARSFVAGRGSGAADSGGGVDTGANAGCWYEGRDGGGGGGSRAATHDSEAAVGLDTSPGTASDHDSSAKGLPQPAPAASALPYEPTPGGKGKEGAVTTTVAPALAAGLPPAPLNAVEQHGDSTAQRSKVGERLLNSLLGPSRGQPVFDALWHNLNMAGAQVIQQRAVTEQQRRQQQAAVVGEPGELGHANPSNASGAATAGLSANPNLVRAGALGLTVAAILRRLYVKVDGVGSGGDAASAAVKGDVSGRHSSSASVGPLPALMQQSVLAPSGGAFSERAGGGLLAKPQLVFRGLRVRMGLTSNAAESEVVWIMNGRVPTVTYTGEFASTCKEVTDVAMGGVVLLSASAFHTFVHMRKDSRDVMLLQLGDHMLKCNEYDQGSSTVDGQRPAALPPSRELYCAVCPSLAARLAILPSLVRTYREVIPGCLSAPAGIVAPLFCNVMGIETLLAWGEKMSNQMVDREISVSTSAGPLLGPGPSGMAREETLLKPASPVDLAMILFKQLAQEATRRYGGYVVDVSASGGHWVLVFGSPQQAALWGLGMVDAMLTAPWPEGFLDHELTEEVWKDGIVGGALLKRGPRLRIGIDYGRAMVRLVPRTGRLDYVGKPMNRAARLQAKAKAASVFVSGAAWEAARTTLEPAVHAHSRGTIPLKGVLEDIEVWALTTAGRAPDDTPRGIKPPPVPLSVPAPGPALGGASKG